ncbi:MAG: hydrogenase nickel incorporation protein HypA [Pseudomonadota bacterium]|jgi:Zn-dependent M16 (insulinase) family peptidase
MRFQTEQIHGAFRVERVQSLPEQDAEARILTHVATGARLMHIANTDKNKVFCIALRTPPSDNTGVAHILEHSVLLGSQRFPVKNLFEKVSEGSLNTFLNAMTYPDRTVYPIASQNNADFFNLMNVYLDTVYFPLLTENSFLQEGWHYAPDEENSSFKYQGVVYNEMRGYYSIPKHLLSLKIRSGIFKGTPYCFDSGGNPEFIPDLSYDEFKKFHQTHYHPSNSWIYLYGDLDLNECLDVIHEKALSKFTRTAAVDCVEKIPFRHEPSAIFAKYPISENQTVENNAYIGRAWCLGDLVDAGSSLLAELLYLALLGTDASPLRLALRSSGLGQDVHEYLDSQQRCGIFFAGVSGTNPKNEALVQSVIDQTLRSIQKSGFPPQLVEAILARLEFRLRDSEGGWMSKGLKLALACFETWLYDSDPLARLSWQKPFAEIRHAVLHDRLLERLFERLIIDNQHYTTIVFSPDAGLAERKEQQLESKIAAFRESLSSERFFEITNKVKDLRAAQGTIESEEVIAALPRLKIEEINPLAERISSKAQPLAGHEVIFVPADASGICYLNIGFRAESLPAKDAPWLALMANLFTRLGTTELPFPELEQRINNKTGLISAAVNALGRADDIHAANPVFSIETKFLTQNSKEVLELLRSLLFEQDFSNPQRLTDLLAAEFQKAKENLVSRAWVIAQRRGVASFSPRGRYTELMKGIDYVRFIIALQNEGPVGVARAQSELRRMVQTYICRDMLTPVCVSCGEKEWSSALQTDIAHLVESFPQNGLRFGKADLQLSHRNSALIVPSQVQFVTMSFPAGKTVYERGMFALIGRVAETQFLLPEIRAKGGAYGFWVYHEPEFSEMTFVSFCDPHLRRTVEAYLRVPEFLQTVSLTKNEFDKLKIGYFGQLDRLLSNERKVNKVLQDAVIGVNSAEVQKSRDAVLQATPEDIRTYAALFKEAIDSSSVAVAGGATEINKAADLFASIEEIQF